jgi:GT2 family glycosyltransferase
VGMAGCLIRNPDGTEQAGCRRAVPTPWRTMVRTLCLNKLFPRHPRFQSFVLGGQPLPAEPVPQEAISGAFMLVRRAALEEVGALDEGYFLHCEDLDWCMRFRQASWQILFVPHAEALHYKGYCSRDRPVFVSWHMHKGMARFYRKFFRHQYPAPLMVGVFGAVWVRFVILAFLYWSRSRFGRTQPDNVPDEETVSTGRIGDTRSVRRRSDPIADNAVRTFALREAARGSHAISRAADDRKSSGARRTKPHGFRT